MDFLKSAVASIAKGPAFPYSFDDRVDTDASIWTLHNSTKRADSSKCSVFTFDISRNRSSLPLARNAVRKLRTLRHPGVIQVLDTLETETHIYIAAERITPLSWHVKRQSLSPETIKWGLYNIAKTIKFINHDASSVHGYIRTASVFTTEAGEWKLGGFELLSSMNETDAVIYNHGSLVPDASRYTPPEISKSGWETIKSAPVHATDSYLFGILIYEVFNMGFLGTDQLTQPKNIPVGMQPSYKRLIMANPKTRSSTAQFLEHGLRAGGFFQTPLIHLTDGIENLGLKSEAERDDLLSQVQDVTDDFPEDFFKMKVLPELMKSVEFGGGGPKVFAVILKIGTKLSAEEYEQKLVPLITRLFGSPDRAMRVFLLDNLPIMIDHLPQKLVSNSIFPQMVTGFTDVAPVVREQTVKAILVIVPKLSDRIVNGELLRYLAKTANDEQPGIRTNTTICLGKIARNLGAGSRAKVLIAAFARALRDPFPHARNAALLALAATADVYSDEDCATKLLPGLCPSLIDKEKIVRDQANKTMEVFMQRIRKYAATLPDTVQPPPEASNSNQPRMETPQPESGWTGWAISSFTNKISAVSGQMQEDTTNGSAPTTAPRSSSMPPAGASAAIRGISSTTRSNIPSPLASKPSTPNPFAESVSSAQSPDPVEAFNAGWNENAGFKDGPADEPAEELAPKPFKATVQYDDKGEPDFDGWLNAQKQAKKTTKKTLPKGLGKSTTKSLAARPAVGKAHSTGTGNFKKIVAPTNTKAGPEVEEKKQEPALKTTIADDGWGDDW